MSSPLDWVVPLLAGVGGGTAGSVTTALLTGRERRRARARRRLRGIERRLSALELAGAAVRQEVTDLVTEMDDDRKEPK